MNFPIITAAYMQRNHSFGLDKDDQIKVRGEHSGPEIEFVAEFDTRIGFL